MECRWLHPRPFERRGSLSPGVPWLDLVHLRVDDPDVAADPGVASYALPDPSPERRYDRPVPPVHFPSLVARRMISLGHWKGLPSLLSQEKLPRVQGSLDFRGGCF